MAVVLAAVVALAVADPSGLLAPVGGRGVPLLGTGGAYRWAPLLVGLPVLLAGTAVPVAVVVRAGGRRVFVTVWVAAVGAGALAAALTGVVAALPTVGAHLSLGSVLRFAFATSGFAGLKLLVVGPLAGAAAALAVRVGPRSEAGTRGHGDAATAAHRDAATSAHGDAATAGTGEAASAGTGEAASAAHDDAATAAHDDAATAAHDDAATAAHDDAATAAHGDALDGLPDEVDAPRPRDGAAFPVAVMFVVVALAAVGFAGTTWRGGPVGYAFAGPLVAPTAAAGVLGIVAGTLLFVGVFAWTVRAALGRLTVGAGQVAVLVWLGAVVAGVCLGVVDAVVAALPGAAPVADAGPDSWWAATAFVALATGIGYGVAVGLLAAAVTGLAWRSRDRLLPRAPHPRSRRLVGAGLAVLLLALPFVTGAPASAGPAQTAAPSHTDGPSQTAEPSTGAAPSDALSDAPSDGMERLQVLPAREPGGAPVIGDATGRQVLLRGVNVNQLVDYYLRDPAVPATQPLTDEDFEQIAAMGFNVVRLGMSWSRLEPARGVLDEDYLREVRRAVTAARANGVYVVLDMHEDAWGNAIARPDERCGGGTSPTTGWDGAPEWATITDGARHCQFMARDLAPAVATAFSNLYTDRDGIQTELVRTWAWVARAFADEPAVAGYDLLNEPGIGANPPISSGLLLGRYYDAAIDAIRDAETQAGGFPHLAVFEPSVLWSGLAFDVTPPPGFTQDEQLVFAPHPYSESISMDQSLGFTLASIERNLAVSSRAAASYGAALWTGEWGWFGDPDVDGAKVQRFVAAQDRLGIGGAFWVWRQGCGSPETGSDATSSGNLVSVDCATGQLTGPPAGFAKPLSRAYPRAFPGRLDSLTSGVSGRDLELAATVESDDVGCGIDVWVPGEAFPQVRTTGVGSATTTKVPGGWRVSGCADGSYTVSVTS
ncbi:glycoside hydrolase family 5 protein [Cellulomonas sp. URHB0016]